jgi:uncharacterized protein
MRILISGASGLVGTALCRHLTEHGHELLRLVRRESVEAGEIAWKPAGGTIDLSVAGPLDAVIHLAGENIAAGRWSPRRKALIRDSRVMGTALLARAVGRLSPAPRVFVAASATGFYGDRGEEKLTESCAPGVGFLSETCVAWESAAAAAVTNGARLVHVRIGLVLSPDGGALPKMLLPFRLGLGGRLGSGEQYMSWIAIQDLVRVFRLAAESERLGGPVNAVAPNSVTNAAFTRALGRVLNRPTLVPAPAFALRLLFGEMADALLLSGANVLPGRLADEEFCFSHPHLESALRHQFAEKEPST